MIFYKMVGSSVPEVDHTKSKPNSGALNTNVFWFQNASVHRHHALGEVT